MVFRSGEGGRCPARGTEREIRGEWVIMGLGYGGDEKEKVEEQIGLGVDARGNIARDSSYATEVPGMFVAGDAGRGASLIVWAIAEGRAVAAEVDRFLEGSTLLPAPVKATDQPLHV